MPQGFCHSARRNWTSSSDIIDFPEGEKSFSYAPGKGGIQMIRLKTSKGDILLEMFEKEAPKTVENFVNYVKAGHYEGTIFHRVIDGFMIQGGGFDETMQQKPSGRPIENEASNWLRNEAYTVAMARTQDPHSATAQFFINVKDNSFLNYSSPDTRGWGYAVFGKVVEGKEVVDSIKTARTCSRAGHSDVPVEPVTILEAVVEGEN
jgi:peptidyl-prolyl cis-trans isomerase B (cyclophilin B)